MRNILFHTILFIFLSGEIAAQQKWDSIKVPGSGSMGYGQFNTIAARGDSLHLIYLDFTYRILYYSYSFDHGKTWKKEIVDDSSRYQTSGNFFPNIGEYHDTVRNIHINKTDKKYFANFDCWRASLQLDSKGIPHICYRAYFMYDNRANWINYAVRVNGLWQKEVVHEQINSSKEILITGETAMALDKNDKPHIVFGHHISELEYSCKENGKWILRKIPSSDFSNNGLSIAIDNKNCIHIAQGHLEGSGQPKVNGNSPKGIEYHFSDDNGKNWSTKTISTDCWWETDITVDKNNIPYITWRSLTNGIFVAHKVGNSWQTDNVSKVVHGGNPVLYADKSTNTVYCSSFSNYKWKQGCQLLLFSTANGENWNTEIVTSNTMSAGSAAKPGMTSSANGFYISSPTLDDLETVFFIGKRKAKGSNEKTDPEKRPDLPDKNKEKKIN